VATIALGGNAITRAGATVYRCTQASATVTPTISVTNNGARRLEALELSLVGEATKEGEQPLLHRFVLGYRPGQKEPPQPAPDSKRSAVAVYLPVGIPVPVGGVSKFDVRVTYLKFADE